MVSTLDRTRSPRRAFPYGQVAAWVWALTLQAVVAPAFALEPRGGGAGAVLKVDGSCDLKRGTIDPVPAKKDDAVRPGDRIVCRPGATLVLTLPGSGAEYTVSAPAGEERVYPVPSAQSAPTPPGHPQGRVTELRPPAGQAPLPIYQAQQERRVAALAEPTQGGVVSAMHAAGLRKCAAPIGVIATDDERGTRSFASLMAIESGCFKVLESAQVRLGAFAMTRELSGLTQPRATSPALLLDVREERAQAAFGPDQRASGGAWARLKQPAVLRLVDTGSGVLVAVGEPRAAIGGFLNPEVRRVASSAALSHRDAEVVVSTVKAFNEIVDAAEASRQGGSAARPQQPASAPPSVPASGSVP